MLSVPMTAGSIVRGTPGVAQREKHERKGDYNVLRPDQDADVP